MDGKGWMKIESAPKDGTGIIGYPAYYDGVAGQWRSGEMYWRDAPRAFGWKAAGRPSWTVSPTHWMPLPPPPPEK